MKEYNQYCKNLYDKLKCYTLNQDVIPKISIIMPCYNVEKYLEKALESILKQTFKEFELICIDDGSKDSTFEILKAHHNIDSRIKLIFQENQGPSKARNEGIKIARGEYISFVDSDDWVDENYLQDLYLAITKNDCDIAVTNVIRKRENSQKYRVSYKGEKIYSTLEEKIKVCKVPVCCYACAKLYKTNLIKNYLFQEGKFFEDVLWLPNALKKSNKIVTVASVNYYYRVNPNSIVKKNTPQKQRDSYFAKRYIIEFFRQNNLELSEKEKNITKEFKYFLGMPIFKIKEKDFINTWLLFSFLPVLKYRDFDSHYIFKFLGIRIAKRHKTNFNYKKATEFGLSKENRNPKLIVSLTSHPARINYVSKTINTLLQQTIKPDKLILWLADTQFPKKEEELPKELLELKNLGLEIKWCEDLKSYKKLVPALSEFPNDIIVTADDDIYYSEFWLESLYSAYLKNPKNIYVKRAVRMKVENNQISDKYKRDECVKVNFKKASFSNQLMGGSGCLFPPNSLHEDIFNKEKFMSLIPTHDDIYFWVMAILKGTKVEMVGGFEEEMLMINGCENSSLARSNNKTGKGIEPKEAFGRISKEYSEILEIITNEFN